MAQSANHGVKVGDVFVESWGYDQTNIDFYEVVKVTAKSVYILAIGAKRVGEGHSTRLVPNKGQFLEKRKQEFVDGEFVVTSEVPAPKRKLVQEYGDVPFLNMSSYSNAYLTDPSKSHFDTIAAGYPGH